MAVTTSNTPVAASGDASGNRVPAGYVPGIGNVPARSGTPQTITEVGIAGSFQVAAPLAEVGGTAYGVVASAASVSIKASPGRCVKVVITTTGTGTGTIYDNTSAAGTAVLQIPASAPVGTIYQLDWPCAIGIFAVSAVSGPAFNVSYF